MTYFHFRVKPILAGSHPRHYVFQTQNEVVGVGTTLHLLHCTFSQKLEKFSWEILFFQRYQHAFYSWQ